MQQQTHVEIACLNKLLMLHWFFVPRLIGVTKPLRPSPLKPRSLKLILKVYVTNNKNTNGLIISHIAVSKKIKNSNSPFSPKIFEWYWNLFKQMFSHLRVLINWQKMFLFMKLLMNKIYFLNVIFHLFCTYIYIYPNIQCQK